MYGRKRLFKYDEQAMLDAIRSVQNQEIKSVRAATTAYGVPRST